MTTCILCTTAENTVYCLPLYHHSMYGNLQPILTHTTHEHDVIWTRSGDLEVFLNLWCHCLLFLSLFLLLFMLQCCITRSYNVTSLLSNRCHSNASAQKANASAVLEKNTAHPHPRPHTHTHTHTHGRAVVFRVQTSELVNVYEDLNSKKEVDCNWPIIRRCLSKLTVPWVRPMEEQPQ